MIAQVFEKLKGKGIYFRECPENICILLYVIRRLVHLIVIIIYFKYKSFMSKFDYFYYLLNLAVYEKNTF